MARLGSWRSPFSYRIIEESIIKATATAISDPASKAGQVPRIVFVDDNDLNVLMEATPRWWHPALWLHVLRWRFKR